MRLIGQRWEFQIGNTVIQVDNAFSWTLWGQERMLVNGEQVHASSGRMRFSQKYQEPWLTSFGDGECVPYSSRRSPITSTHSATSRAY